MGWFLHFYKIFMLELKKFMEQFRPENQKETPRWKRLPITVESGGHKENVWVNYIVEMIPTEGTCTECGKENQTMPCESVKEVRVESDDEKIIARATATVKELVRGHEQKMFVCKDCLNEEFMKRRAGLYVKALEEAQEELGIVVDKEVQRKRILGQE